MNAISTLEPNRPKRLRALRPTIAALCALLVLGVGPARAQSCDDGSLCTNNDLCSEGTCSGTPIDAGSCDDGSECTTGDSCNTGVCRGTPVGDGSACNQGCGRCIAGFCAPNLGNTGKTCNDGILCTVNDRCQFGFCFGDLRTCPNTDGDACTLEVCNPVDGSCLATGQPPCGDCQACTDLGTGQFRCDAGPDGRACEDFNECTGDGACAEGQCQEGSPVSPGDPTRTPTATPTQQVPPTPTAAPSDCLGDCNGDGAVTVDEIIAGVNIALGSTPLSNCPAMDGNRDASVTVDEVVRSVNLALDGCS